MRVVRHWILVAFAVLMAACGGGGSGSGTDDASSDGDGTANVQRFVVRWRASAAAAGYLVHWGTESGAYRDAVDVGAPLPDADGVASFELEYPGPSGVIYFALRSYDAAFQTSAFSNEIAVAVR
ncbi:MAG: hypothetical protein IT293_12545 [Deltaproteobacteria bacterium]|nr:hypothetical protein [Deltaproteobacteria bacterium]